MLWRLFMATFIAGVAGWSFYRYQHMGCDMKDGKRAAAIVEPLMLPMFVVLVVVMYLIVGRIWETSGVAAALGLKFFSLFLQISLYFGVLLCLMPLLRERIGARACATLWILPNLLYVMTYARFGIFMEPLFFLPIPGPTGQKVLTLIWLTGFGITMLWQIVTHFRFRRGLLKGARLMELENRRVNDIYLRERRRCEGKYSIPLYVSDEICTPVTIGCFPSTAVMILPEKEYTEEELTLIFRHEFQHIQRADMRTKFFLAFCAAMCWFNPLMWIARKKASEDLELSCDEEVLKGADEATRRRYAELLLRTAGDGRGFSTCLSAGADSMRYRLKNVVTPTRRTSGTLCVMIAVFVLFVGISVFAFAEPAGTVEELIFSRYPSQATIDHINVFDKQEQMWGYRSIYGWQEEELLDYIGSLRVRRVYSDRFDNYGIQDGRNLYLDMETVLLEEYGEVQDGLEVWNYLRVYDEIVEANIPYDGMSTLPFLLVDEVDWDYVCSLLDFNAKASDPPPDVPRWMQAEFSGEGMENIRLDLSGKLLGGVRRGTAMIAESYMTDPSYGSISGSPATEVKLLFPHEPESYEVLVRNWEESEGYSYNHTQLEGDVLPLANYDAHYTVYVRYVLAEDIIYEMAYSFDVELPEE